MTEEQKVLVDRIDELCREKRISYYNLSYKSTVPMTTLMHIIEGRTKNPGIFTIVKLCDGLEISLPEFFSGIEFKELEVRNKCKKCE